MIEFNSILTNSDASENLNEHLQLLMVNLSTIYDLLYPLCRFYTLSENKLPYLKKIQRQTLSFVDFNGGETVSIPNANFDCFQFVWFILKKSVEYGYIQNSDLKYEQTFETVSMITKAIDCGYFAELESPDQLKPNSAFLFFFTKSSQGMTQTGQRHFGICFIDKNNKLSFFSNRKSKGGVVEDVYENTEIFFSEFKDCPKKYISHNT